jgi:hypothetical protein
MARPRVNEAMKFTPTRGRMRWPTLLACAYFLTFVISLILTPPVAYAQEKWVKLTLSPDAAEKIRAIERDVISYSDLPGLTVPIGSSLGPPAGDEHIVRPWWVALELGEGQLKLTSDQFNTARDPVFALGFVGGHSLGNRARIGLELNGWLLQSFNLNNPAVGESVSNVLALVDVFPIRKTPIFLRAGPGLALYQNNRPGGFNGTGWSWTAGVGYEIPLAEKFGLAPIVDYAAGSLGDVRNTLAVETGRRYSVVEFKVAIAWHFGRTE